jgi:hypothetical protein
MNTAINIMEIKMLLSDRINVQRPLFALRRATMTLMVLVALLLTGCVELDTEGPFLCRAQAECGEGFNCLPGAGCYCVCQEKGAAYNEGCAANPECPASNAQR